MLHWHTEVEQNFTTGLVFQDFQEHMPGVRIQLVLQEVIKAAVTTDLSSLSAAL